MFTQRHCDLYNKSTKRGKVLRVLQERYLRQDLPCASALCTNCPQSSNVLLSKTPENNRYLIPDIDVVLSQMDVLHYKEWNGLNNIIILETVWEQIKKQDLGIYNRLHALLKSDRKFVVFANEHHEDTYLSKQPQETEDDRNARAVRLATKWYRQHLGTSIEIVLLTNSTESTQHAKEEGLNSITIHDLVSSVAKEHPALSDLMSTTDSIDSTTSSKDSMKDTIVSTSSKKRFSYKEHLPMSEILNGIKNGRFFQGTLRCNREHWLECHVMVHGLGEQDNKKGNRAKLPVLISGRENINRGMDGDIVAIEILPKSQWKQNDTSYGDKKILESKLDNHEIDDTDVRDEENSAAVPDPTVAPSEAELDMLPPTTKAKPTGRVIGIIRRNWRRYCGSLEMDNRVIQSSFSLFIPVDRKVPKIRIQTRQRDSLLDKRFVVTIDSWPTDSMYPIGHYVRTIGTIGDKNVETEVLLLEHDIPTGEFSDEVLACLPPEDWEITEENSIGRTDLRHLPVMSIDPPNCKDIDDALHCLKLPNGNLQLGVHIADVTHFVAPGSPLDLEAMDRGTSTYLVERRLDMLPGLLTTQLCSLRGNEDHFAFSVLWEMTPDAEIVNVEFCKSIIHSIAALSYQEAQVLLDDPKDTSVQATSVKQLHHIAQILRQRRMNAGALTLASPEVRFVLDTETQNPLDVQMYALRQTNALVEEFMLLANITVAKKILRHFPTFSLLRNHPAPSKTQFDGLIAAAAAIGIEIKVDNSKVLADSLDLAISEGNPYLNKMIRILTTRCMRPAAYFCSGELTKPEFHHYGLATPIYTHFTSPIRRYADVVVHRLLAAALGIHPLPIFLENKEKLADVSENLNRRHLAAQLAGRASVSLHTLLYFKENPCKTNGIIMRLRSNGIGVLLPRYGIEGRIVFCDKENEEEYFNYNEKQHILTLKWNSKFQLQIFQQVQVYVHVITSHGNRQELKMDLIESSFYSEYEKRVLKKQDQTKESTCSVIPSKRKQKESLSNENDSNVIVIDDDNDKNIIVEAPQNSIELKINQSQDEDVMEIDSSIPKQSNKSSNKKRKKKKRKSINQPIVID